MDRLGEQIDRNPGLDRQDALVDRGRRVGCRHRRPDELARPAVDDDRHVAEARLDRVALGRFGEVGHALERVDPLPLRLVEAQGLKIQLRSPMTPVVKLAFDGLCDDSTIGQLEAVLAWALAQDLPRGSLAGRIEEAGGIGKILSGESAAA